MKIKSKSVSVLAALAMATTGVLAFNANNADAVTVATVHSGVVARLYASNGNLITNRALSPNSAWAVGKTTTINGETMYQVATNEYLRAQDSSLSGQAQQASTHIAGKALTLLPLYRDDTNKMANRSLAPNSEWTIGKYIVNKNGQQFVQVSTHEYADASNLMYDHPMTNPTYIADFGTNTSFSVVGSMNMGNGWGTDDTSSDTSTNTSTDTNVDNSNQDSDTNNSSSESTLPNSSDIQAAVLASINAERTANGLSTVSSDSTLAGIAQKRAQEVDLNQRTHFNDNLHIRPDGNYWYTELKQVAPTIAPRGENVFATPWKDLSQQSATYYAKVVMDNYRGEKGYGTINHYTTLMDPTATRVGVGAYVNTSTGLVSIAEDFAK